jgi:hypothetical protein
LNDLKERQDEVTSALDELNKLAYDEKIIESPKYSQVVGLMVSFNILLNKINSNQEVPPQRFPLDGDCIDCP